MNRFGILSNKYFILELVIVLSIISNNLFAQVKVSEKFENIPLIETLDIISKKYGVKIAYDNAVVVGIVTNINFKNERVNAVLEKLVVNTDLEVVKINDVYIIRKQNKPPITDLKIKNLVGVVRDKVSGESLPYASVRVLGAHAGTSTNPDGFFSIQQGTEDSIRISVSYIGFEPIEMKVARVELNTSPIIVEMDRNIITLSDVKVIKEISEIISTGERPGELVWNSRKVNQLTSISGIDVVAPLQMLPGVDATSESLSGLTVRHSTSDKNLFIYDGFTIYHIDHFFGAFTSFNSKAVKDIRLIRGGFDARWGGRASSVVEITGKTGNENKLVIDAGFDQLSADIAIEGPIGRKISFVLAARRSFTDFYRSNLYDNLFESARSDLLSAKLNVGAFSADSDLPQFYYYDANAKLNFKPTSKDNISISGYQGTDDLNYTKTDESPYIFEDSYWGNQGAGIRWSRQWGSLFYHNLTVGASGYKLFYDHSDSTLRRQQYSTIRDTILKDYTIDNKLSDLSINFIGQLKLGKLSTLEGGFNSNIVDINSFESYTQASNSVSAIDTFRTSSFYSETYTGWIQNTIASGDLKAFTLGFRATYHNLSAKYYFEPRAQLMVNPTEKLTLKFAAGLYNQYVNRIVQFGSSYRNIWIASDGDRFPVVKSKHFIAGFTWKSRSGFLVDFEGYAKNTEGISFLQSIIKRTNGSEISLSSKTFWVDTKALGLDLLVRKSWSNAECWVAYSLSRAFNNSQYLNDGDDYFALDDHMHELKIAGIYSIGNWRFTMNWIYGTPKPWDELLLTATLQISPDYEKNSARLSPYHRLDAGIVYTYKIVNTEIQLGIKGFNLYNRQNVLSKTYSLSDDPQQDYLDGESILVYSESLGLGFTPTLYFNLKF